MSKASPGDSKFQVPFARAIHMEIGFMETATTPASKVLTGVLGTMAANISTMAPIQEIWGEMLRVTGMGAQWKVNPRASAVKTM
jgi:hypothetical protein